MVKKAKALVKEQGILAMPNPKAGKPILKKTVETVMEFCLSELVSRQMPGMNNYMYVSILVDGEKQHVQKHLVLCNLNQFTSGILIFFQSPVQDYFQ